MISGYFLRPSLNGLHDHDNKIAVKYSKSFKKMIEDFYKKGFQLQEARINHIVYWQPPDSENNSEIKIILPEILLKKKQKDDVSENVENVPKKLFL